MSMKRTTQSPDDTAVAFYFAADNKTYAQGVENIKHVYGLATVAEQLEGMTWYPRAHDAAKLLAAKYGYTLTQAAAIIAVLSPQMPWKKNVEAAETVLRMAQAGASPDDYSVPTYTNNKRKAHAIALSHDTSLVSGEKVTSFWRNICDPEGDDVTVDRHAIKVWAGFADGGSVRFPKSIYAKVAADYRQAAAELSLTPAALQAVTWVVYKRIVRR